MPVRKLAVVSAGTAAVAVLVGAAWFGVRSQRADAPPPAIRTVFVPSGPPEVTLTDTLRMGQTLGELFDDNGFRGPEAVEVFNLLRRYKNPRSLRPGTVIELIAPLAQGPTESGEPLLASAPKRVNLKPDPDSWLVLDASMGEWVGRLDSVPVVNDTVKLAGLIQANMYDARLGGDTTGLESSDVRQLIWALSEVYQWRIDFYRDVQPGDAYRMLVEREVRPDGSVRAVRVLAAEFRNRDRVLAAVRFHPPGSEPNYYDEKGESVRRAFLLAPLDFRRVTSGFSSRRFHPVLKRYRAHLGTDYGAPTGTPVRATGDGTVTRASWWGGYGRAIEIRHANGFSTRYAHLSRIGVRPGQRVAQGEIIGRVGSTGLSNASHLHYEFLQRGRHRNPTGLKLPPAEPVDPGLRPAFDIERDRLLAVLESVEMPTLARLADARSEARSAERGE